MRKTILLLLLALLLTGCGKEAPEPGFLFEYRGHTIRMDQEAGPLLYRLGAPQGCSQAPSCDFEGMDTTYFHGGFCLTTYPAGSAEHISGLWFTDDTVATAEGIRIGSSREAVEEAYGTDCFQNGSCVLAKGNTMLTILFTDDTVSAVEYSLIFG